MPMAFLGVGSGEECLLRYVLAPFKIRYVLGKFWIGARGILTMGGGLE